MDHSAFLKMLNPEAQKGLQEKSNKASLLHLAGHWGCIGAFGYLIYLQVPYWQALLLPQGFLLVFCFTLLHETLHNTPFRSGWLNVWVGRICGFALLLPPEWFRFFHLAHHRYTNDPDRDPERAFKKPISFTDYVISMSGLPEWRSNVVNLFSLAWVGSSEDYVPVKARTRLKIEARIMLTLYIGVVTLMYFGQLWWLWCWIIPIIIGKPFLRLYLLAEHGLCPPSANMFENTMTTYTTIFMKFFAWNMPYHIEHHIMPNVPFHKLGEVHKLIKPHLISTSAGYVAFHCAYLSRIKNKRSIDD